MRWKILKIIHKRKSIRKARKKLVNNHKAMEEIISKPTLKGRVKKDSERSRKTKQDP